MLTPNEYQKLALRTANPELTKKEQLLNGILGLGGESGECEDIYKKHLFQGQPLDEQARKHADTHGDENDQPQRQAGGRHQYNDGVYADGHDIAVGKVDELENAVNNGIAHRDDGIHTAQTQPVDELCKEISCRHTAPPR